MVVVVGVEVLVGVGVLEGMVEQSVTVNTVPKVPISTPQMVDPLCSLQYLTPPSNGSDSGDCVV